MSSFKELGVSKWLCETLSGVKITRPTNIQAGTIPEILKGKNCIGGAKTGSGKTIAFAAPMLSKWAEDPCGIYGVILTPTRELAMQIAEQFSAMHGIKCEFENGIDHWWSEYDRTKQQLEKQSRLCYCNSG